MLFTQLNLREYILRNVDIKLHVLIWNRHRKASYKNLNCLYKKNTINNR